MLYTIGFLVVFLFGGITGIILASPPLDFAVSDSYFVVAHFHYVLAGTVLFEMFAGFYFWWPKMTGKMLNSRLGKVQFWIMFIGFNMTFLVQHWAGVQGQVRRTANYPFLPGDVTTLNVISTVGSWLLALSILMFIWNVYITTRFGQKVTEEDPWGFASSLEWATSCPPPRHNFYRIPRIRSERPAFDAALPAHQGRRGVEGHRTDHPRAQRREEVGACISHEGRRLALPGLWRLPRRRQTSSTGTRRMSRPARRRWPWRSGLCLLTGFYLLFTGRRLPMRPEDDNEGEIVQGTGEIGFFSPHSWWPLWVGLAAAFTAVGCRDRLVDGADRRRGHHVHDRRLRLRVLPGPLQPLELHSDACPRLPVSIGRGSGGLRVSRGLARCAT